MKESHGEGVANRTGSESCLDDPRGRGEALAGGSTGELLNSENTAIWEPSPWSGGEGDADCRATQAVGRPGGVRELGMCGHSLRENRETSERSLLGFETAWAEAVGKAQAEHQRLVSTEESDGNVVPKKLANNTTARSWRSQWREGCRWSGTRSEKPRAGYKAGNSR